MQMLFTLRVKKPNMSNRCRLESRYSFANKPLRSRFVNCHGFNSVKEKGPWRNVCQTQQLTKMGIFPESVGKARTSPHTLQSVCPAAMFAQFRRRAIRPASRFLLSHHRSPEEKRKADGQSGFVGRPVRFVCCCLSWVQSRLLVCVPRAFCFKRPELPPENATRDNDELIENGALFLFSIGHINWTGGTGRLWLSYNPAEWRTQPASAVSIKCWRPYEIWAIS